MKLAAMLALSLLFLGSGAAVAMMAPMGLMAFDSGDSRRGWLIVSGLFSYPVLVVLSQLAAWALYFMGRGNPLLVSAVPLLSVVVVLIGFLVR